MPTHLKAYPQSAVAGARAMFEGLELEPENDALEPKVKSLINLAVASQTPCQYCVRLEKKMARDRGATDEEIAESAVRFWDRNFPRRGWTFAFTAAAERRETRAVPAEDQTP